jgi:uncharacterized protein YaiI (UPF0178 family)
MKILIDADASPVRNIAVEIAREYQIPVIIVSNYHHQISSDYAKVIKVDAGRDMADNEIIKQTQAGDLVITQDYGLASIILMKKAYALHQDGWFYTENNIDMLLMQRQIGQKMRRSNHRYGHTPKRKDSDDLKFKDQLIDFIKTYLEKKSKFV